MCVLYFTVLSTEVRFSTEMKSHTSLSSFRLSCERNLTTLSFQRKRARSSYSSEAAIRGVLRNFVKFTENTCARGSFLKKLPVCSFIKKEALAQVFSCEFYEFSKNTFLYSTFLLAGYHSCLFLF